MAGLRGRGEDLMFRKVVNVIEVLALVAAVFVVVMLLVAEPEHSTAASGGNASAVYNPETGALPAGGAEIYAARCAQCHGSDGGGARGFPDLANADWQWGNEADTVVATIENGRIAAMPPWSDVLGEQGVNEVVGYVQALGHRPADAALAAAGKARYDTVCAACHGADGRGNPLVGAPNLTDDVWLYGGDAASLKETIAHGRNGQMPAWGEKLGPQRVKLLAAYVTKLAQEGSR